MLSLLAATVPDAPTNVLNIVEVTSPYQIGIKWSTGVYDGSSPILDYQVSIVNGESTTVYESGILGTFNTINGLSVNTTYTLMVQARNIVGLS